MPVSLSDVYRKRPSFVARPIAGEVILVPITRNVADLDTIYTLDGAGPRLWELLDGSRTLGQIVALLVDEYDVPPETAEADALDFVAQLKLLDALEEV